MSGGMGHNSEINGQELRAFVERVERVQGEIDDLNADKAEIFKESKSFGYDNRILKKVISRRRVDRQKRVEEDEIMALYLAAIGED